MSVLAGTRIGAGLAVGAGFDTATGVSSVATADFWSGGRQGKAELAAMIAEGLEKSRSVQQGGQVLQQFSAWMAQVGAAGGTVDAGAWWDMMARLSATDSPLAQGAAGANLIEQVTAGIRGSRDDEQQLIFTARALKSAGVNASPWELRSIMEQGPFTPVGDTNLISSRFAKFEKDMGADMEANRPAEFYGRMANMLKVDTAAKAEALHKAYKSGELGAPGLIEWQKRFVAGGGDIAPDSYLDLARAKSARDEDLPALFKELSPGMDRKSLARLDQYFPQDGASKYTPEQQREALMAQLAKGRTRTKGGDIAQATADEVTASVAEFGTQLDGATILLKKFKEELFKMGTSKYWLDSGDNRGRSAPEGVFEGASLGIPDVAPLMGARLLKVALGAGGGFGGGGFGGGGGVQPVSWDGSPMGGFGGGGKAGKAGKGAVAPADVYRYLQSKGVSRPHAIGILASIKGESDFRPDAIGDGGASYGLLQFQKERRKALVDKYGSAPNWKQQIDYALSEKEGKDYLRRKFSDSGDAAEWFTRYFEKPKHPDKDSRIRRGYAAGYERLAPDTPPPAETLPRGTRMSSLSGRAEVELDLSFRDPTTGRVLDTKPPRTVVKLRQAGVSPHAVG